MTTIRLSGDALGRETMLVRCDLSQASAPVEVCYHPDGHPDDGSILWDSTPYQCADTRHTTRGLVAIAQQLAARECEVSDADCDWTEVSDA